MAEIQLNRGFVAIVDDADFAWLSQWKWFAHQSGTRIYARRREDGRRNRNRCVYMHRQILGFPAIDVDHRNRNTLDNRRANLREATRAQNCQNKTSAGTAAGYRGVQLAAKSGRCWSAQLQAFGKRYYLGCAATAADAARLYDAAALAHFGEFAVLNFPEERR